MSTPGPVRHRGVLALAAPALGVLAAEPLYVLVDTAVVGHLGAVPLAALGIGGVLLSQVAAQLNFLAYGTTARAARSYGAGRRRDAVAEGVQASWLAVGIGLLLIAVGEPLVTPVTRLLAGSDGVVQQAAQAWLRIALLGAPFILLAVAGNGWMRGVQETRRPLWYIGGANAVSALLNPLLVYGMGLGLVGSAIANVAAQVLAAVLFLAALRGEGVRLAPDPAVIRRQLRLGRDLLIRSLGLQASVLVAAGVAARMGTAQVAAHQIAIQLWMFLALVLDSFAIAAQALVGGALGGGDAAGARRIAWRVVRYGAATGAVFAVVLLAASTVIPRWFTTDPAVLEQVGHAWPWLAGMQPAAGVVFALDGVLIGAGDAAFLRNLTVAAGLFGYIPAAVLAYLVGTDLGGVWVGLTVFIAIRLAGTVWRSRGGAWAVVGVAR